MLFCKMIEQQSELICSNNHQGQKILMVLLDEKYKQNQRLQCQECFNDSDEQVKCLNFKKALFKIQELKDKVYSQVSECVKENIKQLDEYLEHIVTIKTNFIQTINQIDNHVDLWKKELQSKADKKSSFSLLKEIDNINISNENLLEQEKKEFKEEINQINDGFQKKALLHFNNLKNLVLKEQKLQMFQIIFQNNQEDEMFLEESCQQTQILLNNELKESCNQEQEQNKCLDYQKQNEHLEEQNKNAFQIYHELIDNQDYQKQNVCHNIIKIEQDMSTQLHQHEITPQQPSSNDNIIDESSQLLKKSYYKLQGGLQQKESCVALAINFDGSLIAAACNNDIKIWKFQNGNMIDQKIILKGHEKIVFCIIFSKKINWFISGGIDNQIRCWIEKNKKSWFSSHSWEGSKAYIQHTNSILCLLLNENEDQLISSSCDNTIKIWNIKCSDNSLQFQQSLEKHKNQVFQISLNSTETQMVSSSEDRQIILWGKDVSNNWEFKYIIEHDINDYGLRVNFLSDDTIFWCQFSEPCIHVFKLENGKFQQQSNLKIQLKPLSEDCNWLDYCFFPSKYNIQQKVLIIKQNKYIYKIQQNENQQYQLDNNPIECTAACVYGIIQNNLQHIIIWNKELQLFQIYQLQEK